MPLYCYVCRECGEKIERVQPSPIAPLCPECMEPMGRDWKTEGAANDFHPTRDLYGEKIAKQAERERKAGRGLDI